MTNPLHTASDDTLSSLYERGLPLLLVLHAGPPDKPLLDAATKLAKKHADELLVAHIDTTTNPTTAAKYQHMDYPVVVGFEQRNFGIREKSDGEAIRPADLREHAAYLLGTGPDPAEKAARKAAKRQQKQAKKGRVVRDVSEKSFTKQVLRSKQPVLVDFWAPWCGPCRQVSPMVESLGEAYRGKLRVVKVNVDKNQRLSQTYQVRSIPTLMLFQDGDQVDQLVGAQPRGAVEGMIKRVVEA